jgi:COMPASS component SPP1
MNTNSDCNTKSIDNYNNRDSISSKNLNNNKSSDKEDGEIDEEEEEEESRNVYCICRTSDTNKFMIGCDKCEEWYHGICINITEHEAQRIQLFYCQTCRQKDQTLQIIYKERKTNKKKEIDPNLNQIRQKSVNTSNVNNSYSNSNNNINTNSSLENSNVNKYERDPDYRPIDSKTVKNYYESDDDEDDDYYESINDKRLKRHDKEKSSTYRRRGRPAKEKEDKRKKPYRSSTARSRHRKKDETNKKTHKKNKEHVIEVEVGPKQCYGPACVQVARKGSKYCSDECGIKLSTNRIYEILPHRIRQWQSTDCDADQRSHKLLETIRNEQQEARRILNELDSRQKELEILINCGKTTQPMTEEESNEAENEAESELSMYCVTCGHEINHKLVINYFNLYSY